MRSYAFGDWQVLPDRNLVRKEGAEAHLEPKTMEVLVYLLDHPGETVSLQTILEEIWKGRIIEENSVHRRVYQIRKVLGDSREEPTYIENVPRRGYRTLAPVVENKAVETHVSPASAPTELVPVEPSANPLVSINRWLLLGSDRWVYFWFGLIGLIPIISALAIGAWDNRIVPSDLTHIGQCPLGSHQEHTVGFSERYNWLVYPLILPGWLYLSRKLFRLAYGFAENSPLLTEPRYAPIRNQLVSALVDWRPFALTLSINLVLTAVDQWDVVTRFIHIESVCPVGVMDWGWYGFLYPDVSVAGIGLLTTWTTLEQFLFATMAINTAVYVFLFNFKYLRSIYLRSDQVRRSGCYVLDFDDPDQRFGLRKLSLIFDLQLFFCVFGGVVLLVERYMNTNLDVTAQIGTRMVCALGMFSDGCINNPPVTAEDLSWVLQDTAQVFIVVSWLFYLLAILWIANVKLLPLRFTAETEGRVNYLKQFLPPGSYYDLLLDRGADGADRVATQFRKHHFWPTGDDRAADALAVSGFVGLLLLLPVWPNTGRLFLLLGLFALLGWLFSRGFLLLQKHILARVDRSLVQ